jgi:hypothetical protein
MGDVIAIALGHPAGGLACCIGVSLGGFKTIAEFTTNCGFYLATALLHGGPGMVERTTYGGVWLAHLNKSFQNRYLPVDLSARHSTRK